MLTIGKEENGIELISNYLNGLSTYEAIHVVGHGSQDQIQLGAVELSSDSLFQYEDELKAWNRGLDSDADILLYGCEVASDVEGQDLVERIGFITGADVAASDDLTGHADLGGDWEFEYLVGAVETTAAFSATVQQEFQATLATVIEVTTTLDIVNDADNVTSLREACLLYTSPSPRDRQKSRMPSSA